MFLEESRFHLVPQLQGSRIQCSFFFFLILEAKQELMAFPVLPLDGETFTTCQAPRGQRTLQAKKARFCRHQFSPVGSGREPGFLTSLGNTVRFKPGLLLSQPGPPPVLVLCSMGPSGPG